MSDVIFEEKEGHHHSILVGSHCAYCMDCGQILLEYTNKQVIRKLMNPTFKELKDE